MKRLFTLALSLAAVLGVQAQELLVGTYNVRYQNESDAKQGNGWSQRCPVICEILSYESPDIFGTQEAKVGQIYDLLKGLPEYDYIGVARDDGREEGEYSAIFYHKGRLKKIRSGNFWLSETPDRPRPRLGCCLHPYLYVGELKTCVPSASVLLPPPRPRRASGRVWSPLALS